MSKLIRILAAVVVATLLAACELHLAREGKVIDDSTQNLARLDSIAMHQETMVLVTFFFNRKHASISSEKTLTELQARGLRPVNLDEWFTYYGAALANNRQSSDPPRYPIVCLDLSEQIVSGGEGRFWQEKRNTLPTCWRRSWDSDFQSRYLAIRDKK